MRRPQLFVLLAILCGAFLRFHQLGLVPPGLHYDFAANAILANDIAFGSFREVFITAYTGKETLFFYTAALLFSTIGSSIFTLQLTAAIYGVLTIAACYFAARQLLNGWPNARWVAVLTAVILSFTFMHLVWSRYGERATTQPFILALAVGFLFRGFNLYYRLSSPASQYPNLLSRLSALSASSAVNFALAGAFTGLAAYTYLAARIFPIPVAFALLAFLIIAQRSTPSPLHAPPSPPLHPFTPSPLHLVRSYAFFALTAALVFAPLALFFLQHPEAFLVRANQLTPRPGETDLLMRGITGALGMIFLQGEPYDRFNIPGRPIYGPLLGIFFVIGLLVILARLFRPRTYNGLTSVLPASFLLVYTITFLIPTAISVHDIFPSNVRSMGLMPLLGIFPALGLIETGKWLIDHLPTVNLKPSFTIYYSRVSRGLCLLITLITLISGTLTTYNAYFNLWATAPSLHYANDTDLVNAARWINTQDTTNTSVYFSAIHYRHPTVAYLAPNFESFRWFTGATALAIPEGPALYVFPHAAPPPEDWIADWTPLAAPLGPDGTPDFRAYRFDSPPPLPTFTPTSANFGNIVEVTGYRVPSPNTLDVRLRVLNPPDKTDYRLVADLVDIGGHHWSQAFNDSYFSGEWQVGETILMRLNFETPIGMPPGDYRYFLTLFSSSTNTNVAALTPEGNAAAYAIIGPQSFLGSGPQPAAQPLLTFGALNVIQLEPPPAHRRPGEPLPFALYWQSQTQSSNPLILLTKLNDFTLETTEPVYNTYPSTQWQPGEIVIDRHSPRLPRDLAAGVYNITVNDYLIGSVTIDSLDRQLAPPSPSQATNFQFDDLVELVGYDLAPDSITLYWHALAETDTDYTRFVHVLDADGNVIAQSDSLPRDNTYPTSLWLRGEYVREEIQLPTEGTSIEIGWYEAETGQRLTTPEGSSVTITP
jgi:hypothetical protein